MPVQQSDLEKFYIKQIAEFRDGFGEIFELNLTNPDGFLRLPKIHGDILKKQIWGDDSEHHLDIHKQAAVLTISVLNQLPFKEPEVIPEAAQVLCRFPNETLAMKIGFFHIHYTLAKYYAELFPHDEDMILYMAKMENGMSNPPRRVYGDKSYLNNFIFMLHTERKLRETSGEYNYPALSMHFYQYDLHIRELFKRKLSGRIEDL